MSPSSACVVRLKGEGYITVERAEIIVEFLNAGRNLNRESVSELSHDALIQSPIVTGVIRPEPEQDEFECTGNPWDHFSSNPAGCLHRAVRVAPLEETNASFVIQDGVADPPGNVAIGADQFYDSERMVHRRFNRLNDELPQGLEEVVVAGLGTVKFPVEGFEFAGAGNGQSRL